MTLEQIIYDPYWMAAWFTFWGLMFIKSRKEHKKRMALIEQSVFDIESAMHDKAYSHHAKKEEVKDT